MKEKETGERVSLPSNHSLNFRVTLPRSNEGKRSQEQGGMMR